MKELIKDIFGFAESGALGLGKAVLAIIASMVALMLIVLVVDATRNVQMALLTIPVAIGLLSYIGWKGGGQWWHTVVKYLLWGAIFLIGAALVLPQPTNETIALGPKLSRAVSDFIVGEGSWQAMILTAMVLVTGGIVLLASGSKPAQAVGGLIVFGVVLGGGNYLFSGAWKTAQPVEFSAGERMAKDILRANADLQSKKRRQELGEYERKINAGQELTAAEVGRVVALGAEIKSLDESRRRQLERPTAPGISNGSRPPPAPRPVDIAMSKLPCPDAKNERFPPITEAKLKARKGCWSGHGFAPDGYRVTWFNSSDLMWVWPEGFKEPFLDGPAMYSRPQYDQGKGFIPRVMVAEEAAVAEGSFIMKFGDPRPKKNKEVSSIRDPGRLQH